MGLFITFDGPEGSGKSTQIKLLTGYIASRGLRVVVTKNPTDGKIGRLTMEQYLKKGNLPIVDSLLLAADRAEQVETVIKPALEEGKVVISDRYYHCSLAYQGLQTGDLAWIKELNRKFLKPDLTIFIDISADVAMGRISAVSRARDVQKFGNRDFLDKVRRAYLGLAKSLADEKIVVIDGERSVEDVQKDVINEVQKLLG